MRLSPAEDANRRLLRARDAIDRHFAEPLDIPALARVALGFEVTNDVDMGFTRWLTVALPHDPDRHLLLEVPGPPALSEEVAGQVRDVLTKGALGVVCVLTTDDCHKAFAQLSAQGVEFTQEPTEQPYGINCTLRDPFGNQIRIN
ncbi:Glyoxalase/Bleomycin resistance protein/Dioxygenase superfamily protein [Jiangella sp. DSM 45060]|nr:VOC family protein [Jiangella sp. DSM 45060]SDT70012.1 Glyoxalase/Bleomycin resistance protein/Dioxygenase superfamily protein [Jiangella sp. DSM 45060]